MLYLLQTGCKRIVQDSFCSPPMRFNINISSLFGFSVEGSFYLYVEENKPHAMGDAGANCV